MSNQRVGRIALNRQQIEFVMWITEIPDPMKAVEEFVENMTKQRADPTMIGIFVDRMIQKIGQEK